ncbi:PLDc N-terminal domain-containing protein [Pseudoclavibacter terrae]|uniref:PLDc_N domain-containing protein n=1 Tax=Pseudoclavibacter terrae TaxID=1530195 RepID=A0A7J5AXP2_9MICO|nr:PLDc N-terminal domain-containing protein [Pseudoclavibacter terrae]KAB1636198.1 PLDc_N domain-containing protein [Pseudoclavibacter terrae]
MNGNFDLLAPLLPVLVLVLVLVAWCLVDLARRPEVRYLPKMAWAVITIATIPFGAIAYLILGRAPAAPLHDSDLR